MSENNGATGSVQVTASNGVTWTRRPGSRSTGAQLLQALREWPGIYRDLPRQWNWWEEGRRDREQAALRQIIEEWDNGAPELSEAELDALMQEQRDMVDQRLEASKQRRTTLVAETYDKDRESARLQLLRTESDAAFFTHVLEKPASGAQRESAGQRLAESQAKASELRERVGDPEQVVDRHGYLPAERRETNLESHMRYWRHRALREWSKADRRRFRALLAMPMPVPAAMCSECEAPAAWHEYDISLRLFHGAPAAGSQAEQLARLLPGWWERCAACTAYQIGHWWGGSLALPDFGYQQWRAMMPALLRTIFTPAEPRPRKKPQPKPLAIIAPGQISEVTTQLQEAQTKYPDAQVRLGNGGAWELWPAEE